MKEEKELAIIGACVLTVVLVFFAGVYLLCIYTVDNLPFTWLY